jgi:hypothetical protein
MKALKPLAVIEVAPAFVRQKAAARYLGMSEQGLIKMLRRGEGPPCHKKGRAIFYEIAALHAWMVTPPQVSSAASLRLDERSAA